MKACRAGESCQLHQTDMFCQVISPGDKLPGDLARPSGTDLSVSVPKLPLWKTSGWRAAPLSEGMSWGSLDWGPPSPLREPSLGSTVEGGFLLGARQWGSSLGL